MSMLVAGEAVEQCEQGINQVVSLRVAGRLAALLLLLL
jgi:hypothetical protein